MKSQRSFIVEIKSSRRRPKVQASSIWGDTDFKALADEVEAQAPHMFAETQKPAKPVVDVPTAAEDAVKCPQPPSSDDAQTITAPQVDKPAAAVPLTPQVKALRKPATPKRAVRSSVTPMPQSLADPDMAFDALMNLEDVNRNLRARLRLQLEAEHAALVQMLERTDLRNK